MREDGNLNLTGDPGDRGATWIMEVGDQLGTLPSHIKETDTMRKVLRGNVIDLETEVEDLI